jgi:hypothetical protein
MSKNIGLNHAAGIYPARTTAGATSQAARPATFFGRLLKAITIHHAAGRA